MGEEKNFKVINEKIVPSKKRMIKKFLKYAFLLLMGAIMFGVVERVVFEYSGRLFGFHFQEKKKENVELFSSVSETNGMEVTTSAAVKPSVSIASPEPIKTQTIVKKDIKVVEKKIDANLFDYSTIMREFGKIAEENNKSVVEVRSVVMGADWFENPYETVTSTSGFIIASQNDIVYILTKYSEIKKAGNIKVSFYNRMIQDGVIKNFSETMDVALLSVNLKEVDEELKTDIKPLEISNDQYVDLGRPVFALGNPDGIMYSVLFGIINNVRGIEYFPDVAYDVFYSDLQLSKTGFTLLLDTNGKVIGFPLGNKEKRSCKVLSTKKMVHLLENMINDIPLPYLGIITKEFQGAEGKTGLTGGILVDTVVKESPAERAGIKKGDLVYYMDGNKIETIEDYSNRLEKKQIGDIAKLKIYRVSRNKGKEVEIEAKVEDSRGIK